MESSGDNAGAIIDVLTSQPSQEALTRVLQQFEPTSSSPTSSTASVIFAIVNTTIPELWRSVRSNTALKKTAQLIVNTLSSISGVNALLMRLNQLHARARHLSADNDKHQMEDILEIVTLILENNKFSPSTVIAEVSKDETSGKMILNEYISLVGGSKILNVASKVSIDLEGTDIWISDGKRYSKWIGERLSKAVKTYPESPEAPALLGKALNLGYPYAVVEGLLPQLLNDLSHLAKALRPLRRTSVFIFTKHLFQYFSTMYFNYTVSRDTPRWWDADRSRVGAVAGVLYEIYKEDKLADVFVDVVRSGSGVDTLPIQRACILTLSNFSTAHLDKMVDDMLASWADKLFITHTPIMAQESRTQLLLLCLAYTSPVRLREISSSPTYNEGLSNRLSASVDRVRFLGMIVGESISRKIDLDGRQLKFKVPEMEEASAESWRSLIDVDDDLRPLKDLQSGIVEEPVEQPILEELSTVPVEEFLVDEGDDLDSDLPTFPTPASDAEDSDDDPTLVSREKIPTPLYVRELMKYLRADDYNKVHIGLKNAPNLIRQKAAFGTELSDQAHGLARMLVGLQDTYEMEQFQEMRQSALIALVASAPEIVVAYLIDVYFTGDISIQQRLILLSAMGIGARELAGLEMTALISQQLLPLALHRQYISPMDQLSKQLEATMIEPIREAVVSKISGPQILQVRRFSSVPPGSQKPKTTINSLSKLAGRVFVFPLLGRWWIHQQDYGRGVHFEPILLSTFIRTVGVIIHASAPSALDLQQMTKEFWDLLLSMRNTSTDPSVMEAILFGMLVILEITDPRRAAEHFPKHVVETQAWAAGLSTRLEEGKAKLLAGGILLKTKEIVTKHERLLLGDIISFGSISSAPMGLNLR